MSLLIKLIILVSCFRSFTVIATYKVKRPPQFVNMSFDGSKSLSFWKRTRKFAKKYGISFTYFISGPMFLANKDKHFYKPPRYGRGVSHIGFGELHQR